MALQTKDPSEAVITSVGGAASGGAVSSTTPVITGTADAGNVITLYDGVRALGTVTVAADGTWSFTPSTPLKLGNHSFSSIPQDNQGNYGASSAPVNVQVATIVPTTPSAPVFTDDSGHEIPAGGTTADPTPHLAGTGAAGDTVTVYDNGKPIGSTTIAGDGTWSFTPSTPLPSGNNTITVVDTNTAGTPSAHSSPTVVVINTTPPSTPAAPTLTDDTGAPIPSGSTAADAAPHISGTGTAGDIITVYDGSTVLGSTTVDSDGTWMFVPPTVLSTGTHSINVTEGNVTGTSAHSGDTSVTMAAPSIVITGVYGPGHTLIDQNGTNAGSFTIEGTATGYADGDMVTLFFAGPATTNNYSRPQVEVMVAGGKFSLDVSGSLTASAIYDGYAIFQGPGTITITGLVAHFDQSGQQVYAQSQTYTINETQWVLPPAAPTLTDNLGAAIPPGATTPDVTPHIAGTGAAGDIITVYDGSAVLGTTKVGSDGNWTFVPPKSLTAGTHSISVTEGNAGGTSAQSEATSVTTTAPSVAITGVYGAGHTLIGQNGTNTGTFTIEGTASGYADGDMVGVMFTGSASNQAYARCEVNVVIVGGKFSLDVSRSLAASTLYGGSPLFVGTGSIVISTALLDSTFKVYATSGTYTVNETNWTQVLTSQNLGAVDDGTSTATADASVHALPASSNHTTVGEHEAFVGNAANGNETVDLNANPASYFKESTAHIQGAGGGAIDTLHLLGDHQVLDLTSLTGKTAAAKISGIEVIDLGGHANTLKLSLSDVLNLGETDLFQHDGHQQLMVNGSNGDTVDLSNAHIAGVADGQWQAEGTAVVGGVTYNVYEHSGAHTELLVQQGMQVALHG